VPSSTTLTMRVLRLWGASMRGCAAPPRWARAPYRARLKWCRIVPATLPQLPPSTVAEQHPLCKTWQSLIGGLGALSDRTQQPPSTTTRKSSPVRHTTRTETPQRHHTHSARQPLSCGRHALNISHPPRAPPALPQRTPRSTHRRQPHIHSVRRGSASAAASWRGSAVVSL
jgi:hypothetical protein